MLFETTQVHAGVSMQMKRKAPLRNFVGDDDGEDGEGGGKGRGTLAEHIGSSTVCWTFIVTKGRIGDNLQHCATDRY